MKKQLKVLLEAADCPMQKDSWLRLDELCTDKLADYLINAGVLTPRFKIGQKVWLIDSALDNTLRKRIYYTKKETIAVFRFYNSTEFYQFEDVNQFEHTAKELYATKKEADAALINYK